MIRNYLKIAYRNLIRHKTFSLINIFGLSIGLTVFVLLMLFITDELSFDRFHEKAGRIYRVVEQRTTPVKSQITIPFTTGVLKQVLKDKLPQVENTVNIISRITTGRFTVQNGSNKFYSGEHIFTEPSFFDIFNFELIYGNKKTALNEPNSVILTESEAVKLFGSKEVLGKVLQVESREDCRITGIIKDPPQNSHLKFNMVFSLSTLLALEGWRDWLGSWRSDMVTSYILLRSENYKNIVENKLQEISHSNFSKSDINNRKLLLQPIKDVHFYSNDFESDDLNYGKLDVSYIYILSAIAFFILFIASINFINLSTSKAASRAKEVGLRKVLGAFRNNLTRQFLGESLLIVLISLLIAVILIEILLPFFNSLTGKEISINYITNWQYTTAILLLAIIVGILAGGYPALYLSKFEPAAALKGNMQNKNAGKSFFRNGLVVFQFTLSVIMIISTIIAYKQLNYIRTKNLGFNKEELVIVDINSGNARKNYQSIKAAFEKHPGILGTATSSRIPGDWKEIDQVNTLPQGTSIDNPVSFYFLAADEDFASLYNLSLVKGRYFRKEMGTDSTKVIINETAAKILGWDEPVGKKIKVPEQNYEAEIIGVVGDFHIRSLHEKIAPVMIGHWNNPIQSIDYFSVKINSANLKNALEHLQTVHEQFDQITPFEYNFLDERMREFYASDQRLGKLFAISALVAIIIACMGLFALSSHITERKTKEIGIRKILGANISGIMIHIFKQFVIQIFIANMIAFPIAYLFSKNWLNDFAYRIEINPFIFLGAGLLSISIALITVSYNVIKASIVSPVNSLRYE